LWKDTQYFQYCNNVKLHAVQATSTRFLTTAHINNKELYFINNKGHKVQADNNNKIQNVRTSQL